jgi:pilus assembly protein CpaB
MVRRITLLLLAAVVAAVGTGLVFLYAHNADQRAIANTQPEQVLMAVAPIGAGTTAAAAEAAGAFQLKPLPKSAIAEGALSDITAIRDKVANGPILPGEQILLGKWGDTASFSQLQIPATKMAVAVQLTDPGRVAGFVTPGSRVAVFVDVKPEDVKTTTGGTGATGGGTTATNGLGFVRLLLPKADVLASGPTTLLPQTKVDSSGTTQTDQVPKAILTLAVDQKDATRLIYAAEHGSLYFALLRDDSKVAPAGPVTAADIWPAGSAG